MDDSCHFQSRCPECKERKPVSMKRNWLKEALDGERDVKVLSVCGHTWSLSAEEKQNLRTALRAVLI